MIPPRLATRLHARPPPRARRPHPPRRSHHTHTRAPPPSAHPPLSPLLLLPLPLLLTLHNTHAHPLDCSPTFQGVPVAATFLMHQALPRFDRQFPGLELSPVFDMARPEEYSYTERGGVFAVLGVVDEAVVVLPVFEKLPQVEEARLGAAGIRKMPVGRCELVGRCRLGCAKVELVGMRVLKGNGECVWEWRKKGS
ncbi:uncharacterized protein EV422DRAFT_564742 [Fimicolochytrium jonesii]|uniref:uncharacterized protein n=1 Tax=Fimicolochytrium jonesii TaxID=1396493 RepID=UPI0022FE06AF|nr:uncharacterized protein EV422DRAFT_564742 [Fimicolochytrium jonesii]KAI8824034.1 hypothetical protein EV422DRAFT_564742 [Fimicolochytrium jonesii]